MRCRWRPRCPWRRGRPGWRCGLRRGFDEDVAPELVDAAPEVAFGPITGMLNSFDSSGWMSLGPLCATRRTKSGAKNAETTRRMTQISASIAILSWRKRPQKSCHGVRPSTFATSPSIGTNCSTTGSVDCTWVMVDGRLCRLPSSRPATPLSPGYPAHDRRSLGQVDSANNSIALGHLPLSACNFARALSAPELREAREDLRSPEEPQRTVSARTLTELLFRRNGPVRR